MGGGQCVFFWRFIAIFLLKKTLATNTKGVFHLKSPKTDSNFFGRGGRVPSHLCLLAAVLRVPSNNGANLTKSVWICLGMLTTWHNQQIGKKKHSADGQSQNVRPNSWLSSSCRPLILRMRPRNLYRTQKALQSVEERICWWKGPSNYSTQIGAGL
jgi:hypothetical protein